MLSILLTALGRAYTAAQTPNVRVEIAEDSALGAYLTDAQGYTLYIFLNDIHTASHCYDRCAETCPPFTVQGEPLAGEGVNAELLGIPTREDGKVQVTYNGYPPYTHAGDTKPSMMAGQDFEDTWCVISPEGYRVASGVENSDK